MLAGPRSEIGTGTSHDREVIGHRNTKCVGEWDAHRRRKGKGPRCERLDLEDPAGANIATVENHTPDASANKTNTTNRF